MMPISYNGRVSGPGLPGYRLLRPVGRGSYGVVWEVDHEPTGRRLAAKLFHRPLAAAGELDWLGRTEHLPRVVPLHDARLDHEPPFLVMPLMAGSLRQPVRSEHPPDQVVEWLEQMCHGLTSLHESLGICHCDLKPSNVLVDERRDLYLADFGKAAYLGGETGHLGTLGFMPPEQATLKQPPDSRGHAWDIYGLGATGHYLLTGDFPRIPESECLELEKLELEELLAAYRTGLAAGKLDLDAAPRELAEILQRCLELDPEQRFPSATELLDRLRWLRRRR